MVSFSTGLHTTLLIGRGDNLEADSNTGARTDTEAPEDPGTGDCTGLPSETGTVMAFSIRLWTLEGSMICSSGGGVGPMSLL